ncbi:hypothetical protein SAMN02927903_01012 [Flavobacterium caeni]|uniref:Choice-of-anchor D domain-containing protein n=2 Tax=Flavobacterium caeni TaxID=490189 RepID=A0A1G5ECF4_9FLAO|nr:hypothetical protein SAMN02927903_01012 [Flavobacterium caeni]
MLLGTLQFTRAQVSITNAAPTATVNFSNTMQTSVGTNPSTRFEGDGFQPNPTLAGRLNSNAWEVKGWSFGNCLFGGTQTVDDFGRGSSAGGVVTPGIYAYTDLPATVANPAMLIQPGDAGDFDPGSITLRIRNNGTTNLTQIAIDYNLFVRNDQNSSSSFNFSHSADNVVFVNEPLLDYTSPDVADAFQWVNIGIAPSRTCVINGLNIAPGGYYYVRWTSGLVSGTGECDEFGLDDIVISGTYGAPAPEINVTAYGNTLLSGDVTPTVVEGTEYAPSYAPMSTLLTTLQITYTIQNLGGLPLNVSAITVTGPHPTDFTVPAVTLGAIPAASATISTISFNVIFDPSQPGLRQARINIFSDDANENPYFFDVQGYGVIPLPDIRLNGATAPNTSIITDNSMIPNVNNCTLFSAQPVGGAGEIKSFAIRNDCPYNAPLLLTDPSPYITISGANPADFTLQTIPSSNSINPGFVRNFSIQFLPTGTGIRTALVTIPNNDPDAENPFTFLIQGTGVAAEMDVTGNAQPVVSGSTTPSFVNHTFFDYLNINTGQLDRTFTIINNGNVILNIGAPTLTGANAADFSVITAPPATLAIGASTTFTIRFDPSAVGLRTAIVNIVNSDLNENPYTFAVSGYGLDYIPCAFEPIQTLGVQDFETVPATPAWTYTATGSTIGAGTAFGATGDGGVSSRFVGARSLQVVNGTGVVTMANINTTAYSVVELSLRLASLSTTAVEGSDVGDRVMVSVSTNGGTTWSNEIDVLGNTNAKWSFTSGTGIASGIYDGDNVVTTFNAGASGFLTTDGFSTLQLTGLPKSATLAIRISMTNNSATEIWALDNVTLFGRREMSTTWNGTAWNPSAPTPTVKAIIDGNYNTATDGDLSSCKCEIRAGRTVTISGNDYFDVQSDVENSGTLIVENNGSLVQHNDLATNLGAIRVRRHTTDMVVYDYSYWSSPVVGQTLAALSPNTLWDKYFSYSPTIGNWQVIPNGTAVMEAGKGYIIRAPQGFNSTPQPYTAGEFVGVPNNGFIQTPIIVGASNMNLIGNPYASAISANAFLSNAANTGVVEGTIYLWTHNTPITAYQYNSNDYAVYNFSGSVATRAALATGLNMNIPNGNIASGQGFFIKGLANGDAVFNNSMRITGGNNQFFRMATANNERTSSVQSDTPDAIEGIEKNRVWLNLTNDQGAFKQTLIGYIEGATNGLDRGFDGELFNANNFVSLYSIVDDKTMAIQGRSLPFHEDDTVALGYYAAFAGVFEIEIDHTDGLLDSQNIYLEDRLLQVVHDLKQSAYSFQTAQGSFNDRFVVRYENETLATSSFAGTANAVLVTVKDRQINLFSQQAPLKSVAVYDLLGRELYRNDKLSGQRFTIDHLNSAQQALVVKVMLENGAVANRKVLF